MLESDIRPEALLKRYLELSAEDAEQFFFDAPRLFMDCVACNSSEVSFEFSKNKFAYSSCKKCGTLYQTPRPTLEKFERFYRDSISSKYWAEIFFPAVAEARREKIFRPRAEHLHEICKNYGVKVGKIIDVGAGYGILLDEWRRLNPSTNLIAIEPSASLAHECRAKGFEVLEEIVENVKGYQDHADLVLCFEVLEHVFNPLSFVKVLADLAKPGGYIFVSTLSVDGFDIQTLWDRSNSIFPPHHINFLSIEGFQILFERAGLKIVNISTPGVLDVDIVRNAVKKNPEYLSGNNFVKQLLKDVEKAAAFQKFLSENCMSSHAWILAKKPEIN